ncbi:SRPBCC family protein [Streptomyces olivaceus]|uniref:SRPBCC family protein n=1 Tax=Streptomyces olivaceus TaxID=47716 RepID=UPI001CCA9457|nr:SRPBCC family protein [Streptomyces olivaceus]MBZ6081673.1 SRPBCC family protein [Streptomyces olivaceus]
MASTSVSRVVQASPEQVWELIGGFHSLPDWLPYIPKAVSEQGGRARRLTNAEGGVIVERMTAYSAEERYYSYAILQAPFPVTGYLSTLRVFSVPGRPEAAEIQWSGRFVPEGVSDEEVETLFAGIYRDGLEAAATALANR